MNIGNLWADLITLFVSLLSRDLILIPVVSICLLTFVFSLLYSLVGTGKRL